MDRHAADPAAGFDAKALGAAERARARGLVELLAESRADVREGVEPGLRAQERALRDRLSLAGARALRAGPAARDALDREIESLTDELERLEAQIRVRSPRYASLTQPEPISLARLQALLDEDTLLLEYALEEAGSYAWVVGAHSLTSARLPARGVIEAAARRALAALETASSGSEAAAATAELGRLVLGPLAEPMARGRRLLVVADGALQYVPFAALPHPGTGQPLVASLEVMNLPSATTLALLRGGQRRAAREGTVAVLADPVFDRGDERLGATGSKAASPALQGTLLRAVDSAGIAGPIPRLPFTRREAQAILAAAPPRSSLRALDFDASRATAMDPKLARYRVVHFATHGFLNASHPELSGIVLSLVDRRGRPQPGFLTAADTFNLRLNADLVVLSGCRTALGKDVKGEGIVGLTRGFMYAGADRVLASLWRVDDAGTAALMSRFYAWMLGPQALPPAAALRAAQQELIKQPRFHHPFFWAAFQLQGDWR
jgi:CHAT domain-containing protein